MSCVWHSWVPLFPNRAACSLLTWNILYCNNVIATQAGWADYFLWLRKPKWKQIGMKTEESSQIKEWSFCHMHACFLLSVYTVFRLIHDKSNTQSLCLMVGKPHPSFILSLCNSAASVLTLTVFWSWALFLLFPKQFVCLFWTNRATLPFLTAGPTRIFISANAGNN